MPTYHRGYREEPDTALRAPQRYAAVSENDRKTSLKLSYFTPVLSEDAIEVLCAGKSVR